MVIHVDRSDLVHEVVIHNIIVAHLICLLELKISDRWSRKEFGEPVIVLITSCFFLCLGIIFCIYPATSKMGWRTSGTLLRCCWWSNGPSYHRGRLSSTYSELHATSLRCLSGLNCASINILSTTSVALSKMSGAGGSVSPSRRRSY